MEGFLLAVGHIGLGVLLVVGALVGGNVLARWKIRRESELYALGPRGEDAGSAQGGETRSPVLSGALKRRGR